MKTLQELNREFTAEYLTRSRAGAFDKLLAVRPALKTAFEKFTGSRAAVLLGRLSAKYATGKKLSVFSVISDALFYMAIAVILVTIFSSGMDRGAPKSIFGYTYFTVVSRSMQDEIPKGAFILVKKTDDLKVGDNITFMRDLSTSVTHKIVGIYEDYNKSGARGYQTMGVNNANPDTDITFESNVVGKVIFVLPYAGACFGYLKTHIHIVLIIFGLSIIFSFSIRGLFVKPVGKNRRAADCDKALGGVLK